MQGDGNFVVYRANQGAIWNSETGTPGSTLAMQGDGNLVVYAPGQIAKWNAGTQGSNTKLVMQDDGNLVVYGGGRPLWASRGGLTGFSSTTLLGGQGLGTGQALWSQSGEYQAIMQGDGNFVVYRANQGAIWNSATNTPGSSIVMQGDGNLVVYAPGQKAKWDAGSQGANARLIMQNDGNLVVYSGGRALWSSKGGRPPSGPSAPSTKGQAIVNAAASRAGTAYCHGNGFAGNCLDCSGLARYAVFQGAGVLLPWGWGMQSFRGSTRITDINQLAPGDLVFFGGTFANFEHVGVYAGNGMMWHTANTYIPVQLANVARWARGQAFVGGARY